jgi:predicted nucleic-acid-binding Zn-ribbon protein
MRNGLCPKCNSEEIYLADVNPAGMLAGDGQPLLRIYKEKGFWPDVTLCELNVYLCRTCGYTEMQVRDVSKLEKLEGSTNWKKLERNA